MSNSGPGSGDQVVLKIAVPYGLVLRLLRALDGDERQRALADELFDAMPHAIVAKVESGQASTEDL